MFDFFKRRDKNYLTNQINSLNEKIPNDVLVNSLNKNVETIKNLFQDVDLLIIRYIHNSYNKKSNYCIAYCDGVINPTIINDNIIRPLMMSKSDVSGPNLIDNLIDQVIMVNEAKKTDNLKQIIEGITYGDTILFAEGTNEAIILNTRTFLTRNISEPDSEKCLSGPREGFNESILQNLSMIRRKIRTNELKMKFYRLGKVTETRACICYLDGMVNKQVLNEVYRRLDRIDIDAILDTNYITELTRDSAFSPFRATGSTERPDVVVSKLLEGRIAIFLDGTPNVLTVPYLFIENFQSCEDYYMSYYYTSFSRFLRIIGFILTIIIPGLYIAVVAFHHEMLPTPLLISIANERQSVPLPAALEALILLTVFDILRETGIRMPTNIGQALSIVGALVIGQAAVEAKLVASPMIIVVALTGITGLMVPKLNSPIIYIRVFLLLLSSTFGFFGLILGLSGVIIHILNLYSFGVSQVSLLGSLKYQDIKDTFFRAPWWKMINRPKALTKNKVRLKIDNGENYD